jgi:hypothetical protein
MAKVKVKVKVKFTLEQAKKSRGGVRVYLYSFFNLGARWGGWSMPRANGFTPGKETQCLLYRRLGGTQGWSGRLLISCSTEIRSLDRQPVASPYTD